MLTAPSGDFYDWSTGAHSASITVLEAGTYTVTVYDDLGCGYTPPQVVIDLIPLPQGEITAVEYNEFDQPTNYYYNNYLYHHSHYIYYYVICIMLTFVINHHCHYRCIIIVF